MSALVQSSISISTLKRFKQALLTPLGATKSVFLQEAEQQQATVEASSCDAILDEATTVNHGGGVRGHLSHFDPPFLTTTHLVTHFVYAFLEIQLRSVKTLTQGRTRLKELLSLSFSGIAPLVPQHLDRPIQPCLISSCYVLCVLTLLEKRCHAVLAVEMEGIDLLNAVIERKKQLLLAIQQSSTQDATKDNLKNASTQMLAKQLLGILQGHSHEIKQIPNYIKGKIDVTDSRDSDAVDKRAKKLHLIDLDLIVLGLICSDDADLASSVLDSLSLQLAEYEMFGLCSMFFEEQLPRKPILARDFNHCGGDVLDQKILNSMHLYARLVDQKGLLKMPSFSELMLFSRCAPFMQDEKVFWEPLCEVLEKLESLDVILSGSGGYSLGVLGYAFLDPRYLPKKSTENPINTLGEIQEYVPQDVICWDRTSRSQKDKTQISQVKNARLDHRMVTSLFSLGVSCAESAFQPATLEGTSIASSVERSQPLHATQIWLAKTRMHLELLFDSQSLVEGMFSAPAGVNFSAGGCVRDIALCELVFPTAQTRDLLEQWYAADASANDLFSDPHHVGTSTSTADLVTSGNVFDATGVFTLKVKNHLAQERKIVLASNLEFSSNLLTFSWHLQPCSLSGSSMPRDQFLKSVTQFHGMPDTLMPRATALVLKCHCQHPFPQMMQGELSDLRVALQIAYMD